MRIRVILAWALLSAVAVVSGADESWPKEIVFERGTLTVYQPQADSFVDDVLEGRAAVSWKDAADDAAPVFGAVWLKMRVDVDREERLVSVRSLEVPQVRFPEASEEDQQRLAGFLERELPGWDLPLELDRLVADLDLDGEASTEGLRHDPPRFVLEQENAVLVTIDGEPRFESFVGPEQAKLERVVNTPFLIVRSEGQGMLYLSGGGDLWYRSVDVLGPWSPAGSVPKGISALVDATSGEQAEAAVGPPPKIVVATEPTELVVTDGPPRWAPVEGVEDLLYMENTESDVFLEIASQSYYILLSGRWFCAPAVVEELSWRHVANDKLPVAFAEIPEDSATGAVLAHVAGTPQAREAVLDSAIPQTAAVNRDDASLAVEYDGEPRFEKIEGAKGELQYAVNTPKSVFKYGSRYFSCDQGVWYEANSATGPWRVCVDVPDAVYSIPPSNPHHNVTYVQVYDVTPKVVYVGYTPGYLHSYYSSGCVVYGTGWIYSPWYGRAYYPHHWTWGFRVSYNPWHGWGFGVTYSNGPFTFSFGTWGGYGPWYRPPYHGWWGPCGYRPIYRPYPPPGYTRPPRPVPYAAPRPGQLPAAGAVARPATRPMPSANVYDRPATRDRLAAVPQPADRRAPGVARDRANDIYADRSGNVYRRDQGGQWQQRDKGQWQPAQGLDRPRPSQPSARPSQPTTRPATPGARPSVPSTRPSVPSMRPSGPTTGAVRPQLERDHRARQSGSVRSQGFQSSRPSGPRPSAGGGLPRPAPRSR